MAEKLQLISSSVFGQVLLTNIEGTQLVESDGVCVDCKCCALFENLMLTISGATGTGCQETGGLPYRSSTVTDPGVNMVFTSTSGFFPPTAAGNSDDYTLASCVGSPTPSTIGIQVSSICDDSARNIILSIKLALPSVGLSSAVVSFDFSQINLGSTSNLVWSPDPFSGVLYATGGTASLSSI